MKSRSMNLVLPACLLSVSMATHAETEYAISAGLLYFDYTEFLPSGSVFNEETGWLPGLSLAVSDQPGTHWTFEYELAVFDGSVDYAGNTQTTTDATITRLAAGAKRPLSTHIDLAFNITYNKWIRDIRDSDLIGPYEIYRWWEMAAGIDALLWQHEQNRLTFEAAVLRTLEPTIYVDLTAADYGSTTLDMAEEWGGRLQLNWSHPSGNDWSHRYSLFYHAWDFGRSNTRTTSGGSNSIAVYEPRSESRHVGLQITLTRAF